MGIAVYKYEHFIDMYLKRKDPPSTDYVRSLKL